MTLSVSFTRAAMLSFVRRLSSTTSSFVEATILYSVPLMVIMEPSAIASALTPVPFLITSRTESTVVPIVYPLEPMEMLSPYFSAVIVNVAVPVPTPFNFPASPASFADTMAVELLPLPFNRYVSLNLVVSATRSISVSSCVISF